MIYYQITKFEDEGSENLGVLIKLMNQNFSKVKINMNHLHWSIFNEE